MQEENLFPASMLEALAMAYVSKLPDVTTPEDFCRKYWEAYYRMDKVNSEASRQAKAEFT